MKIAPINSQRNTRNRMSFKSVVISDDLSKITKQFDEERKNVRGLWGKKKKRAEINARENAALRGYAMAQAEKAALFEKLLEEKKRNLELAIKNNENIETINALKENVKSLARTRDIQKALAKRINNKGWEKIAGYENEKTILQESFIDLIALEQGKEIVEFPNCILFFGPTGNGKTTFAKAFAEQAQCNFAEIEPTTSSFKSDLDKLLKESKANYKNTGKRTIILLDEFDAYGAKDCVENKHLIPVLKSVMQSCADKYNATLFLTTNNPEDIDEILLAPKRVPISVSIDPPNKENAIEILKYYLGDKTSNFINYDNIVNELFANHGSMAYSNSKIKSIVENCFKNVEKLNNKITEANLIEEIRKTEPDITKECLNKYNSYLAKIRKI